MSASPDDSFQPDRSWWDGVFAAVDARDTDGFLEYLAADAEFRFGNAPVITGHAAIAAAVSGFFAAIASSRHRVSRAWNGVGNAACEGVVSYGRHDGSTISFPFANVFEFRADKISAYRIYIDNAALFR